MTSQLYSHRVAVAGTTAHIIAIFSTVFRFADRIWTRRFWWEDAWATLALISDVVCLLCIWSSAFMSIPWVIAVAFTCVLWAARMSMVFSIIRVGNPSGCMVHKQITYLIAASFVCMWVALLVLKVNRCLYHSCLMAESVAISQLLTDIIADVSLLVAPLYLWKNVGLSRSRKILVISTFGASLLITAITIPHAVLLLKPMTETTLIFAHVKAALSLVICNLLVIVTFAYRVCWRERFDLDQSFSSPGIFTSVAMGQFPYSMNTETLPGQEGINSRQAMSVQSGATKTKMEDGTSIDDFIDIEQ